MSPFVEIVIGICGIAALSSFYGLIRGCFRYWTREPYDDDLRFMDFVKQGIINVFQRYALKGAIVGIILILVLILDKVFL